MVVKENATFSHPRLLTLYHSGVSLKNHVHYRPVTDHGPPYLLTPKVRKSDKADLSLHETKPMALLRFALRYTWSNPTSPYYIDANWHCSMSKKKERNKLPFLPTALLGNLLICSSWFGEDKGS